VIVNMHGRTTIKKTVFCLPLCVHVGAFACVFSRVLSRSRLGEVYERHISVCIVTSIFC
jgi:hypothetical protein